MKKHFYSHLITIETVHIEVSNLDLSDDERKHLEKLSEENLHSKLLDTVLSELKGEDKKIFMKLVHAGDHHSTWRFLNKKTNNLEYLIKEIGGRLVANLHHDIRRTKSKSG